LPAKIEELQADIAFIFSFSLTELNQLYLDELIEWHDRAMSRAKLKMSF